jgi:hypothetical protein
MELVCVFHTAVAAAKNGSHFTQSAGVLAVHPIHGDLQRRSQSRLAVLPNTTHITLMEKGNVIVPMVNGFLDAKSQKK